MPYVTIEAVLPQGGKRRFIVVRVPGLRNG
jgi:hypothetical protein